MVSGVPKEKGGGFDMKALRAFRVLRPLRLVSGVPSKNQSTHADSRLYTLNSSDTLNIIVMYYESVTVPVSYGFYNKLGLFVHLQAYRW